MNNKAKIVIQIFVLAAILWIVEFIYSLMQQQFGIYCHGYPLTYYIFGADLLLGSTSKVIFYATNLLIDILFWIGISSLIIIAINILKRKNKNA